MGQEARVSHSRTLSIAGLQRSGTNYLMTLLSYNLGAEIVECVFWKHLLPDQVNQEVLRNTAAVLISRHPILWLQSCEQHYCADLKEQYRDVFENESPWVGYAKIYNKFYNAWLSCIAKFDGVHLRHEDLLVGDSGPVVSAAAAIGRTIHSDRIRFVFDKVSQSLEFRRDDIQKSEHLECNLSPDAAALFWKALDPELLLKLGYEHGDVSFSDRTSLRGAAYQLLYRPDDLPVDTFLSLETRAEDLFPGDIALSYAIAQFSRKINRLEMSIAWYQATLLAISRGDEISFNPVEKSLIELDSIENLSQLYGPLDDGRPGDDRHVECSAAIRAGKWADFEYSLRSAISMGAKIGDHPDRLPYMISTLSQILHRSGRLQEAAAYARQAVALKSDHGWYHERLASLLFDQNQMRDAEIAIRQAVELGPPNAHRSHLFACVLRRQDRLEEAASAASIAVELSPGNAEFLLTQGQILVALGKFEAARATLARAIDLAPGDAHCHCALSDVLERQGRLEAAIGAAMQAAQCANAQPWHFHRHGVLLAAGGRLADARGCLYRAIGCEPGDARHRLAISDVLARSGRLHDAVAHAKAGVRCENAEPWNHHGLGVLLSTLGHLDEAEESLRLAVRGAPRQWRSQVELSAVLARRGKLDEALAAAEAAITAGADEPRAFRQFGMLLGREGRFNEAIVQLTIAGRTGRPNRPRIVLAFLQLGAIWLKHIPAGVRGARRAPFGKAFGTFFGRGSQSGFPSAGLIRWSIQEICRIASRLGSPNSRSSPPS